MRYVIRNKQTGEYFTATGTDDKTKLPATSPNIDDAWSYRSNPDESGDPPWYKAKPAGWEVVPCRLVPVTS